jgi:hypothetical protein
LPVSISIMVVSICICIAALVRLDELTMPKRFWKHASNQSETETTLAYLKGNDLWELQKRMVFYWWCLTAVATSLTGASLLLMLLPLAPRELPDHKTSEILVIVRHIFGWTLVGVIVLLIYFAILGLIVRCRENDPLKVFKKLTLHLRSRAHLPDYGSHEHPMLRHRSQRRRESTYSQHLPIHFLGNPTL